MEIDGKALKEALGTEELKERLDKLESRIKITDRGVLFECEDYDIEFNKFKLNLDRSYGITGVQVSLKVPEGFKPIESRYNEFSSISDRFSELERKFDEELNKLKERVKILEKAVLDNRNIQPFIEQLGANLKTPNEEKDESKE